MKAKTPPSTSPRDRSKATAPPPPAPIAQNPSTRAGKRMKTRPASNEKHAPQQKHTPHNPQNGAPKSQNTSDKTLRAKAIYNTPKQGQ